MPHSSDIAEEYRSQCAKLACKVNSGVMRALSAFDATHPLVELDLSDNYVGRAGMVPLLHTVKSVPTLARINLSSNYLTNDSVRELCGALQGHTALQHVDLSSNPISHSSGRHIRAFLNCNPNVVCVRVGNTLMNPALRRIIERKGNDNSRQSSAASARSAHQATTPVANTPDNATYFHDLIPRYGIALLSRNVAEDEVEDKWHGIRTLQAAAALLSTPRADSNGGDDHGGPDQWYALELVWKLAASVTKPEEKTSTPRNPRSSSPARGLANVMAVVRNDERLASSDNV